jgi:alpha-L-rhamnosidase
VRIVKEVGAILGKNVDRYEGLHAKIREKIKKTFKEYNTQTECVLALYFDVAQDKAAVAEKLNRMIKENGNRLTTGFVGTPFLLHALSQNGYCETAYSLLLQDKFPSWLYSVKQGATTIWEHWDGKNENGDFWSKDMNSFNHYAYGSVADWVYEVACGIKPKKPGFSEAIIEPHPTDALKHLSGKFTTRHGTFYSKWYHRGSKIHYIIKTPVKATIIIDGVSYEVEKGTYRF